MAGIAVVREADYGRPQLRWVLLRTLLLAVIVPALVVDENGRAMHDRAAGLRMVRTRGRQLDLADLAARHPGRHRPLRHRHVGAAESLHP